MKKKIQDYLHLYLGCEVMYKGGTHFLCGLSKPYKTNDKSLFTFSVRPNNKGFRSTIYSLENLNDIKLILRPLSDMTEEENKESSTVWFNEVEKRGKIDIYCYALMSNWFRNKGFDIDDLISEGLAIDKTTITP